MARRRGGLNFRKQRRKFNLPLFKEILSWIIECAIVICMAYVLVSTFGVRTNIVGPAMESTLQNDDDVFINKFIYMISRPKAGDVVVFLPNGNEKSHYYIRRVVAAVYVNDELYNEQMDVASMEDAGIAADPITLGKDEYFVLGDNRNNSEDSRYANIGNVKKEYIIGKAWFRFSGISDFGMIK